MTYYTIIESVESVPHGTPSELEFEEERNSENDEDMLEDSGLVDDSDNESSHSAKLAPLTLFPH